MLKYNVQTAFHIALCSINVHWAMFGRKYSVPPASEEGQYDQIKHT